MTNSTFLLYNKATEEALKKASRLPPLQGGESFYKPAAEQKLLSSPQDKPQATGSLRLLKITTAPNGGSGAARGKIITVNSDGTYTEGEEVSVICLALQ